MPKRKPARITAALAAGVMLLAGVAVSVPEERHRPVVTLLHTAPKPLDPAPECRLEGRSERLRGQCTIAHAVACSDSGVTCANHV